MAKKHHNTHVIFAIHASEKKNIYKRKVQGEMLLNLLRYVMFRAKYETQSARNEQRDVSAEWRIAEIDNFGLYNVQLPAKSNQPPASM